MEQKRQLINRLRAAIIEDKFEITKLTSFGGLFGYGRSIEGSPVGNKNLKFRLIENVNDGSDEGVFHHPSLEVYLDGNIILTLHEYNGEGNKRLIFSVFEAFPEDPKIKIEKVNAESTKEKPKVEESRAIAKIMETWN